MSSTSSTPRNLEDGWLALSVNWQDSLTSFQRIPLLGVIASPFKVVLGAIQIVDGLARLIIFGVLGMFDSDWFDQIAPACGLLWHGGKGALFGTLNLALYVPLIGFSGLLLYKLLKVC